MIIHAVVGFIQRHHALVSQLIQLEQGSNSQIVCVPERVSVCFLFIWGFMRVWFGFSLVWFFFFDSV